MNMRLRYLFLIGLLALGLALAACNSAQPIPTAAPSATPWVMIVTATPTVTPIPTATTPPTATEPPTPTATAPPPPTPTFTPRPTATRVPPTATRVPPTATPYVPPPQTWLQSPANGAHVGLPNPVHFVASAAGTAALDRIELWGAPQGRQPQQYWSWSAGGNPTFTGAWDWEPPYAGAFIFFLRAYDVRGQAGVSQQAVVYIDSAPPPPPTATPVPAGPSLIGNWGAQANDDQFLFVFTDQKANGKLKGTFTLTPANSSAMTTQIFDSSIQGQSVNVRAQIGSVMYIFTLQLSGDNARLEGVWTTADTGLPQPVTFNRLLM